MYILSHLTCGSGYSAHNSLTLLLQKTFINRVEARGQVSEMVVVATHLLAQCVGGSRGRYSGQGGHLRVVTIECVGQRDGGTVVVHTSATHHHMHATMV